MDGAATMKRSHLLLIAAPLLALAATGVTSKIKFQEVGAKSGTRVNHHTRRFAGPHGDVLRMFTSGGAAVAVGDYDGDGFDDLFVTDSDAGKTSHLFHNNGDMTFTEVTAKAGVGGGNDPKSIVADALWFDYDNDGKQDLLVARFGTPILYHNEGNGKFKDVTDKAGFGEHTGWTLDIGHGDFNNDGLQDIYLACDYGTDRIFFNNGDGTFKDTTEKSIGFDTRKGMNAEIGDYDNDGWLDIYVTNITDEYMKECNMLWHNNHDGTFTDVSNETGTCATLWGWGAKFADFDNDGWLDLFVVNGLRSAGKENYIPVLLNNTITKPGVDFTDVASWPNIANMTWSGYQKKKMFKNLNGQAFKEISAEAGVDNDLDGRGVAIADFDNDGKLDIYQSNADQPSLLYRSVSENVGNWLQFKLTGTKSNRDAIGARITVKAAGLTQIREIDGGNGYAGQSMKRAHFGIGSATKIDSVEVKWPTGVVEKIQGVALNKMNKIVEGKGLQQ